MLTVSQFLLTFKSKIISIKNNQYFWLFSLLLLTATTIRLYPLSHGIGFHPDERHMVSVTNDLSPNGMNPKSFAYGSLPFYLCWATSRILATIWPFFSNYDGLFYVGRLCAIFFAVAGILITYFLARRAMLSKPFALLAAALICFNPFHLQLSRFFAVDIFLSTLSALSLWAIIAIYRSGQTQAYLTAGLAIGLALATKVSALSLLIPLSLAWFLDCYYHHKFFSLRAYIQGLSAILVVCTIFLIAEPFALIDYKTFIAHTYEQINMAAGNWRPPYTIQYQETLPFIYHLEQMWHYTLGAPVLILGIIGILLTTTRLPKRENWPLAIIACWTLASFFTIAGLQVKFPRYLLPLYTPLCIFGAFALQQISHALKELKFKRLTYLPGLSILLFALITCFSFIRIYGYQHSYEVASRWIFANVPPGNKILSVDWDDKLPLSLPGLSAHRYQFEGQQYELQLYHQDNQDKIDQLSSKLNNGDYLVLPTARSYGALPRIQHEYPITTNFFRLLFAEKLGFQLVQSFKVRPGIGSWSYNDDTADESLWVYDHPKVLVFKRTEDLGVEEIKRRLKEAYSFGRLPTRSEMLLKDANSAFKFLNNQQSSISNLFAWSGLLLLLLIVGLPFSIIIFGFSADYGFGLARIFGLLSSAILLWLFTSIGWLKSSNFASWICLGLVCIIGWSYIFFSKNKLRLTKITPNRNAILCSEALFWFGFLLFVIIRAFNPDIFWGEKPMDFTFLNYFIRLETLPPQDPWALGQTMHYYYFGSYLMAFLHKLSGVDSAIGYNLCIATLAGLGLSSSFALLYSITRKTTPAILGAATTMLASNIEVLNLFFFSSKQGFDLFWASTRLLKEPAITEYPLWALLFADLHAHLIALPISIAAIACILVFFRSAKEELSFQLILHRLMCGLLIAILFITNSWDAISYSALLVGVLLYCALIHNMANKISWFNKLYPIITDLIRDCSLIILAAAPIILIFNQTSGSEIRPHFGFNQSFEFNNLSQLLRHLGHLFLPLTLYFTCTTFSAIKHNPAKLLAWIRKITISLLFGLAPLGLGLLAHTNGVTNLPWDILSITALLATLSTFTLCSNHAPRSTRISAALCLSATYIIASAEICFLMDHMNTIFKFYNAVWLLLCLSFSLALPTLFQKLCCAFEGSLLKLPGRLASLVVVVLLAICSVGSLYNISIMASFRRVNGPIPTLNGIAYLQHQNPAEAKAIDFLRQQQGVFNIVEAYGPSYQGFTRVSMHSGLPTVLGWEHHISQRGTKRDSIRIRKQAIDTIYSSESLEETISQLKLLAIKYIFIGQEENRLYSLGKFKLPGLAKFERYPEHFKTVFNQEQVQIIEVISQ